MEDIPHPDPYDDPNPHTDPALAQSGVKSRSTFLKSAKLVLVKKKDDLIEIEAWKNMGPRGGHSPMDAPVHEIPANDPELVGATVRKAMSEAV